MAHRTSFIPVLGLAALLASAAATRAVRLRRRSRRSRSRAAKPAAQKPATTKPAAQKPSTAKPAADKAAAKPPNAPFPAEPPKAGVPRDFKVPEPKRFTLDNGLAGRARAVGDDAEGARDAEHAHRQRASRRPTRSGWPISPAI